MKIVLQFNDQPEMEVEVHDTETGRLYFDLIKNQKQKPFYRDTAIYTPEFMLELAKQAKKAFGWDWISDHYDISVTAQLHKDLEQSVGKLGFHQIPEEYDSLLYDLHHCLHAIQFGPTKKRLDNFQIEWFTDESIPLPESFEFKESSQLGDLILINPYVGHNPLQIYRENDFTSLQTTCRFHDVIKPGIVLTGAVNISKDTIVEEFRRRDTDFFQLHGEEKIRYYSGTPVIGRVVDIDVFKQILDYEKQLVLDRVEFYE